MNASKHSPRFGLVALSLLMTTVAVSAAEPVAAADAARWQQHLTPLPREITIAASLRLQPADIAVVGDTNASQVIDQAVLEMKHLLRKPAATPESAVFKITMQLVGPEAGPLKSLKNSAQAYRIVPEPDGRGLRLVALSDRGLYYAGKTLQQLLRARMTAQAVEVPLTDVKDWPEMETRGLWGGDSFVNLPWLAERKMNYQENLAALSLDRATKRGRANVKGRTEQLLTLGPRMGIEHAPAIRHLEQLAGTGLFDVYPELRGRNATEGVICYAQPAFVSVLADWIADLGSLPTVQRVDVWLSENLSGKGGCLCEKCKPGNRSVTEVRAVLAAWNEAKKRKAGIGLRVLTSEATFKDNTAIFAELPPEVGAWYYHMLTYSVRRDPMIVSPVEKAAQSGHWMGVVPSLVAYVGWAQPFTSAHFVHTRMAEFTDKGLRGMIGYATPRTMMARFNVEAAMEWLWNPAGRTPREFALSWAVRQKLRDPEKFAEWADLMGPVEWAIYGSEWPSGEKRKSQEKVAALLAKGNLPELGVFKWGLFGLPWGDIKTPAQLEANARAAARGVQLAREIGLPEFIQESLVIQGYADSLLALWELKQIVARQGIPPEKLGAAREQFNRYERALEQSRAALRAWESAVPGSAARSGYTREVIAILQRMSGEMKETAGKLGVK